MASRVLFRRAAADFRSVRGQPIAQVQRTLDDAGLLRLGVDGEFGGDTEQALKRYQAAIRLEPTGVVDLDTWKRAVSPQPPSLFQRCLQLTADFEGHGFGLVQGNFDGAGLTWGIIGFTLQSGGIQAIIRAADGISPALVDDAFLGEAPELRRRMASSAPQLASWADSITTGASRTGVKEPWLSAFRRFGKAPQVQELQVARAQRYWTKALAIAHTYLFTTELGYALGFDIAVQNGGIEDSEADEIDRRRELSQGAVTEARLRQIVADVVAEGSKPRWVENVRRRKLAIATGEGTVNSARYRLRDWGLDETMETA